MDASKAPRKQRGEFVALAVRRAAPFPDADFDVAWSADGTAAVWYWSRSRVAPLSASEPARRKRFVAEALYTGHPRQNEAEILQLAAGFEARAWKSGHLLASRWWPAVPTLDQWKTFLRGAGLAVSAGTPPPKPRPALFSAIPWSRQPAGAGKLELSGLDQYMPRIALGASAILLIGLGVEVGSIARAQLDIWQGQSAAADLDAPLKRILEAREISDTTGTEITNLLSLQGLHPTISLMAELTRLMPDQNWQLKKWTQATPDTLEVNLIAPASNPEALVSAWEASPMFSGVTTELGRENELIVKATVTRAPDVSGDEHP